MRLKWQIQIYYNFSFLLSQDPSSYYLPGGLIFERNFVFRSLEINTPNKSSTSADAHCGIFWMGIGPWSKVWRSDIPRKHLSRTWGNLLVSHSRNLMLTTYMSVRPFRPCADGLVLTLPGFSGHLSSSEWRFQWWHYCWYPSWISVDDYFTSGFKKNRSIDGCSFRL